MACEADVNCWWPELSNTRGHHPRHGGLSPCVLRTPRGGGPTVLLCSCHRQEGFGLFVLPGVAGRVEDGEVLELSFQKSHPFFLKYTDSQQRLLRERQRKKYGSERYSKERLLSILMNVDCYSSPRLMAPKKGSALKIGENQKTQNQPNTHTHTHTHTHTR